MTTSLSNSPIYKQFIKKVETIRAIDDVYTGKDSINKYATILAYNEISPKKERVNIVAFNKKRTKLNQEEILQAEEASKLMLQSLDESENNYKKEQKLKKFEELDRIVVINGLEVKLSELVNNEGNPTNSSIADYIVKTYNPFTFEGNSYYYMNGIYLLDDSGKIGKSKVNQITEQIIEQLYDSEGLENKRIRIISEIQVLVMMRNRFDKNPFDQYDNMICIGNGILKFNWVEKTFEVIPHSPKYIFLVKHAFYVDEKADTNEVEVWLRELSTDCKTNEVKISTCDKLIEAPAVAIVMQLTHGTFKASYLAIGEKDSGKTTFLEDFLKNRFFGLSACSGSSLKSLCDDRFGKDAIVGKSVNICDELTDSIVNYASSWKKITGGAYTEVELKFKQKINVLFPMSIFSANGFPQLNNVKEDTAFWSRWNVLEFPNKFKRDFSYASNNLDKFVSPFALLVIKKIFELHETKTIKNDDFNERLLSDWKRNNDSFESFVFKFLEFDEHGYVQKSYLYDMYKEYCDEKSFKVRKLPTMFNESILNLIPPDKSFNITQKRVLLSDQTQPHVYIGIRLKTSCPENLLQDSYRKSSDPEVPSHAVVNQGQVKLTA